MEPKNKLLNEQTLSKKDNQIIAADGPKAYAYGKKSNIDKIHKLCALNGKAAAYDQQAQAKDQQEQIDCQWQTILNNIIVHHSVTVADFRRPDVRESIILIYNETNHQFFVGIVVRQLYKMISIADQLSLGNIPKTIVIYDFMIQTDLYTGVDRIDS